MKLNGIKLKGYRIDKSGKLVKSLKHLNVIQRLQRKDRVRIVRKGTACST